MNGMDIKELWERYFGELWRAVGAADIYAGAFLLDDDGRQALCDGVSHEMLELPEGKGLYVDYDAVRGVLDRLIELRNENLPLTLSFLNNVPEGITAGIVALNDRAFSNSHINGLLVSQAELFEVLGKSSSKRALLLTKVQGTEGSRAEQQFSLSSAVSAILETLPEGTLVSQREKDELWILLCEDCADPLAAAKELRLAVENCKLIDHFGEIVSEHNYMSLMTGVCQDDMLPTFKMHAATLALYQAMANGKAGEELFESEHYSKQGSEYGDMVKFSKLLDQNLFKYHFQPIVSARTGDIVAYEALMRTGSETGFNPLKILDLATRYGRLYDIELATVKNTMAVLSENQSYFDERSLFINAIPSQVLTDEDFAEIKNSYGELMEKVVVELTESTELDDASLNYVIERIQSAGMQVAIDDYGTGYSNTSNLLRYRPQVVKLDRSLIADIDRKPRMQKLVAGTIEFLHSSGMLALGEGVETIEEIRTLIFMSVDLLQGYYVSRPKPVFVNSISEDVKNQIVAINLEAAGLVKKIYHAADGETVDMQELALEKFSDIYIEGGKVTLLGSNESLLKMPVTFSDGAECVLTMKSVGIEAKEDEPTITLGHNCDITLICEGNNILDHSGIYVPESSSLTINGIGKLTINPDAHDSYAIGNSPIASCGEININMDGHLQININGENAVGIGAGHSKPISINAGKVELNCNNVNCVGIGGWNDNTVVNINNCDVRVEVAAATAVCIGSMQGSITLIAENTHIICSGSGNRLCGIGTMDGDYSDIRLSKLKISTLMKGKNIVCIGSYGGASDCHIMHVCMNLYAEGGRVSGVGDMEGGGDIFIDESELNITFLTSESFTIGNKTGTLKICNVLQNYKLNE